MKPLSIGTVNLDTNLLLAPIAGYCDVAFRLVCRSQGGVGLACTDLLCPEGVLRENKRSMELAATCPEDSPLCMQLYGGNVDKLCEAAMWAEDKGAHVIEITTYRADTYDGQSRKPEVSYGDSIEADLSRRDFAVNAMAVPLPLPIPVPTLPASFAVAASELCTGGARA